ncbi:MAG: RsmB/NOP family class I SAM-dependent RNA methyltransferase [Alphaproteobacteria bacterium]|nr:RsmB/NOP family class I SAM-dependent RNA methyltransferase [Alphaproteobacteria bacterium]
MRAAAHLQATIDLLNLIDQSNFPADDIASRYFREHRYIGSSDRKVISQLVFDILRVKPQLEWLLSITFTLETLSVRLKLIAYLCWIKQWTLQQFQEVFRDEEYYPKPLRPKEYNLIKVLNSDHFDSKDMPRAAKLCIPVWLEAQLEKLYGTQLENEMRALNLQAPLDLRVNTLKASQPQVLELLKALNAEVESTPLSPIGLRLKRGFPLSQTDIFKQGMIEIQDEGSQVAALLVDAKPGMKVIDLCAGAGGKTLALAAQMNNKGQLFATDISKERLDRAALRFRRAGVSNVERHHLNDKGWPWLKRQAGRFDRVLIDSPCGGSGTWRRHPDLKWRIKQDDLKEIYVKQSEILKCAQHLVKPGGRLIYVTCSILEDENEAQIEAFLISQPNFTVLPIAQVWKETIGTLCPVKAPYLRLTPAQHATDGFFVCILEKKL